MRRFNLIRHFKKFVILGAVFLAAPFFYAVLYFKKSLSRVDFPKRILIIDNAKIGDLICATPVFRAIKEKYPESYLAVLAIPRVEEILQNNKNIDELMIAPLNSGLCLKESVNLLKRIKSKKFDICINLIPGTLNFILPFFAGISRRITSINDNMGFFYQALSYLASQRLFYQKNTVSVRHYLDLLKFFGIQSEDLTKEVFIDALSQKKATEFLAERGIAPSDIVIGLCLSAGNKIKEWSEVNFAELADRINHCYDFKIIAIGGPADELLLKKFKQLVGEDVIITYGDFSLKELPALIKRFNYFISVDTGPLFIANALGVPVVDIVGPFNYVEQAPYYEKCEIVKPDKLACWPCLHIHSDNITKCPLGHYQCLKTITPEMVLSALGTLINRCN